MLDGTKVKARMVELGLTGDALASLLAVAPCTVSRIIHNRYPEVKLKLAERLAWILRVHLCDLCSTPHADPGE